MGPYGSTYFKTLLLLQIAAETFLNFLSNGPHKTAFAIFEILKIKILTIFFIFVNMGPNMSKKISKRHPSYTLQPKVFKLFLNFPPNGSHKTTSGIFEIWASNL